MAAVSPSSMRGMTRSSASIRVTASPSRASSSATSTPMKPAPTITAAVASPRRTRSTSAVAARSDLKLATPGSSLPGTGACRRLPDATSRPS